MKNNNDISVLMAINELPAKGKNYTGSPAHFFKIEEELKTKGLNVKVLEVDVRTKGVLRDWHHGANMSNFFFTVPNAIHSLKPNIIHCHGHKALLFALPFARIAKIPIICEIHGLYVASDRGKAGTRPLRSKALEIAEPWAIKRATHIIAQAQSMKQRLVQQLKMNPDRITVIYPGIIPGEFTEYAGPAAYLPTIPPNSNIVMYVGSTHRYQGLELLARAQRILDSEKNRIYFVLVLSSDHADQPDVNDLGFNPNYTRIVHLQDNSLLPSWLRYATILVHARPDSIENINVQSKLGLYLASGKPIVSTNVGDYPSLLSRNKGVLLVEPKAAILATAIHTSLLDKEMEHYAAVQGPQFADTYFNLSSNIEKLINLYKTLLPVN